MVWSEVHALERTGLMVRSPVQRAQVFVERVLNGFGPNRTWTSAHCTGHIIEYLAVASRLIHMINPHLLSLPRLASFAPCVSHSLRRCLPVSHGSRLLPSPLTAHISLSILPPCPWPHEEQTLRYRCTAHAPLIPHNIHLKQA